MESLSAWSQCPTVVSNDPVKSFRSPIPFPSPASPPLPSTPPLVEADDMHMHCTEPECMSGSTLTTFGPYPDSLRGFRIEDSGGRHFHIATENEIDGEYNGGKEHRTWNRAGKSWAGLNRAHSVAHTSSHL